MGEGSPRDRVLRHEETCAIRGALDDPSVLTCASNARRTSQPFRWDRSSCFSSTRHNSFREEHCGDYPHFGLALTALLGS